MTETDLPQKNQKHSGHVKTNFWHTYLGLILQLALFAVILAFAGLTTPMFFNPRNWFCLFLQRVPYIIIALALVLTTRVKGIDLSTSAVFATASWAFAYFASHNMLIVGLMLALVIGLAAGLVNGAVYMFIRIPSAALKMVVTAAVTFGVAFFITRSAKSLWDGRQIPVQIAGLDVTAVGLISLVAALVLVLALLYFTKLGGEEPIQKRFVFTAYTGSGLLFSVAACYMVIRLSIGSPMLADTGNVLYLLFASGAILINKSNKIRFVPVVCALLAALNWSMISNLLALCGVNTFHQFSLQLVLTAAILTPAFMVQRGSRLRY